MRRSVVLVVALLLAGCGSGTGASRVDPATLAPPRTLALATLNINPQGTEKADFDAAFAKLLGGSPEQKLGEGFTRAARTNSALTYADDVKPWLGDSLSLVVTRVARAGSEWALLAASNDDGAARKAIAKDLEGSGADSDSYRGVDFRVLPDGTVNAVFQNFLIAGNERTFKAIVDAVKDDNTLADTDQWKASAAGRADGKTGLAYVDARGLIQSAASSLPGAEGIALPLLLGTVKLNPFVATLDSQPDKLVVDISSPGTPADRRGVRAASSPLIDNLPARAWFALALPDVGPTIGKLLDALQSNPLIAAPVQRALASVKQQTGLDVRRDVVDQVDDVGVYATGSTPGSERAALVVDSSRPGPIRRVVARLDKDLRVVAARSLAGARLGSTGLFKKAALAIGQRPTLFVDFARALRLAAASRRHAADAHFQRALPRLRHIEYVATGARRDGGLDVIRTVVGIR